MAHWCPLCGSDDTRLATRERRVLVAGVETVLPDDVLTHCNECGEDFYDGTQSRESSARFVAARREVEGLLSSGEIRAIRKSVGLTQAELERVIGTGPKTVVRWENDSMVQSKTADDVLRLIAFNPENLRHLEGIRTKRVS